MDIAVVDCMLYSSVGKGFQIWLRLRYGRRSVRDLGITWNRMLLGQHTSPSPHKVALQPIHQVLAIRRPATRPLFLSLIVSLDQSRLDYGNATLAGSPSYMFDRLQSVLNAAAPRHGGSRA